MASEPRFDWEQENSLLATPLSSVMSRLRWFQDDFTSPQQDNSPVTSPTKIRSFLETPTCTSSNEPPPLNDDVVSAISNEQQIVPRLVTPMTLLDESNITQELVSDDFCLQLQATQQIPRELDEAWDIKFERNRSICEDCEAREVEQQQRVELA